MSKLFDTLEKIRANEGTASPPAPAGGRSAPHGAAKSRPWLMVVLAVGIVAVAGYGLLSRSAPKHPSTPAARQEEKVLPAGPAAPVAQVGPVSPVVGQPQASPDAGEFARLNALGAACVDKNQHWRGIYYFRQAHTLAPERQEPLINLAVAYAELGLYGQANEYLAKAVAIDPQSEPLQANLKILFRAGLLEESLVAALVSVDHSTPGGHGVKRP